MGSQRVLYIDDEEDILILAKDFFTDEGINLDICSDYNKAIQMIRNESYDVIISDATMPTGSGESLFTEIKETLGFRGKFILVTGNLENIDDGPKFYDDIFFKPMPFQELISKVKSFLSL